MNQKKHWDCVYEAKKPAEVSWYQPHLSKSLALILETGIDHEAKIIDVGSGASTLAEDLFFRNFRRITAVDLSAKALSISKERLGETARSIHWVEGDITQITLPEHHYDLWHDRAVFHFLVCPEDRKAYIKNLKRSLKRGGHVILATFSLKGPERCSGLEVVRYEVETLRLELGSDFQLQQVREEDHLTPKGVTQHFLYCYFVLSANK